MVAKEVEAALDFADFPVVALSRPRGKALAKSAISVTADLALCWC